jgi:hypothetical protein
MRERNMTKHLISSIGRALGVALVLVTSAAHAQALEPLRAGGSDRRCATSIAVFPSPGMAEPAVKHLGLWSDMAKAWTFQRVNQQKLIKDRLAALGLRDVNVVLAVVPPFPIREAACAFNAIPQTKQVFLRFEARDNALSAVKRRGVFGPKVDIKVAGTFDLNVAMFFGTNGPPGKPLVLQRAEMTIDDFRLTGATGPNERAIANTIRQQRFPDAGFGTLVAIHINNLIRQEVGRQAMGAVTPGARGLGDLMRLYFDVRIARPVLGPAAVP